MKKLTVGQKLAGAFGIVILISLIGSAISIVNFLRLNDANGWNIHSYRVLRANDEMLANMVNMETGVRGYVISGDDKFLDPYLAGQGQFAKAYEVIRGLTSDNAAQQQRLEELLQLRNKVGSVAEKLIGMRRDVNAGTQPLSALTDEFKLSKDKQFMDRYRAVAADVGSAEQALLDQRSGEVATMTTATMFTLTAAGLITITLAIVLGIVITRGILRALGGEPAAAASVASRNRAGRPLGGGAGSRQGSKQPDGVAGGHAAATEGHRRGHPVVRRVDQVSRG